MRITVRLPTETKTQRRDRIANETSARLNRWSFFFCLWPRRLWKEEGDKLLVSDKFVFLETIARRARDKDGMFPFIHGPVTWVLTQPDKKVIR